MLLLLAPVLVCAVALLCDRALGEPRYHPLVAFGRVAGYLESRLNHAATRLSGGLAVLLLVGVPGLCVYLLQSRISEPVVAALFDILILTVVIGWRSMKEHASAVAAPLARGELVEARQKLSLIVSRQTGQMDEEKISGSVIESLLENGNDCLFASLFWYAVCGPVGAVVHRLVNTLDAMWGYKNDRFVNFGYAAARLDDVLGWIPARLTAFCYALSGSCGNAMRAGRRQIGQHKSPNGGLVMATGAGALNIIIGGSAVYDGVREEKVFLGVGERATPADIGRTIRLIDKSILVWLAIHAGVVVSGWGLLRLWSV